MNLAILLWSVSADRPDLAAAPFVYAAAAGALDAGVVEIHFAGRAVELLRPGIAAACSPAGARNLYAFMQDATAQGARFLACSMAMAAHLPADAALIPEYGGSAGATAFTARALDPEWRTLVF